MLLWSQEIIIDNQLGDDLGYRSFCTRLVNTSLETMSQGNWEKFFHLCPLVVPENGLVRTDHKTISSGHCTYVKRELDEKCAPYCLLIYSLQFWAAFVKMIEPMLNILNHFHSSVYIHSISVMVFLYKEISQNLVALINRLLSSQLSGLSEKFISLGCLH